MIYLACLVLGLVAGLRVATALAALCWGAALGWIDLSDTLFAFLGHPVTAAVATVLAILEFVGDQLPQTPARTTPPQFGARILFGAATAAILALTLDSWIVGSLLGVVGAVAGTLGGYQARTRLVKANGGSDRPVALAEDAIAIFLGFLAVWIV